MFFETPSSSCLMGIGIFSKVLSGWSLRLNTHHHHLVQDLRMSSAKLVCVCGVCVCVCVSLCVVCVCMWCV